MAESIKRSAPTHGALDFGPRKRGKYTTVACNECKRRKLKCSGGEICQRCASDGVACVYAHHTRPTTIATTTPSSSNEKTQISDQPSWRFKNLESRMLAMQTQLDIMSAEIEKLQKNPLSLQNTHQSVHIIGGRKPPDARWTNRGPVSPTYIGPTSSEFGLNVPNDASELDETENSENVQMSRSNSASVLLQEEIEGPRGENNIRVASSNPLLSLAEADALRLVDVYEEAVALMYPVVDLRSIREYIAEFYRRRLDQPSDHLYAPQNGNEAWWFTARDTEVLKIVLALALISESNGKSELGDVLAASVEDTFASTRTQVPEVDMKELIILTLVALYHSFRDNDVLAWRTIGMATLGVMQMGLHSSDTWLKTGGIFPGDLERSWAINLFWCIYVFDKEFSFETGLPFSMRDSDMDSTLPQPADSYPYLNVMISYCRVGSEIWDSVVGWGSTELEVSLVTRDHLNDRINEWENSMPPGYSLKDESGNWAFSMKDVKLVIPQILLHLRANQMRILINKKWLLDRGVSPWALKRPVTAVENAKDTIKTLKIVSLSPTYVHGPHPFDRFLFSALATLFLAMFNLPETFRDTCRDEFYDALYALKRSSTRGKHSRRLQKVMKNLKRINRNQPSNPTNIPQDWKDPNSSRRQSRQQVPARSGLTAEPEVASTVPLAMDINSSSYAMPPTLINESTTYDYNDLTNFLELAGDCFADGQSNQTSNAPNESSQQFQGFVDLFQAENETLTRLMAGLL